MLGFSVTRKAPVIKPGQVGGPQNNHYLSNAGIVFCIIWSVISALSSIPPIIAVLILWRNNDRAYTKLPIQYYMHYLGNDVDIYGGTLADGYVVASTIPKQVAGYMWVVMFHMALITIFLILVAADLAWYFERANGVLKTFHLFAMQGDMKSAETLHVMNVAFFKFFAAVSLGSQAFATFGDGNGRPQRIGDSDTWEMRYIAATYLWFYIANAFLSAGFKAAIFERMTTTKNRKALLVITESALAEKSNV